MYVLKITFILSSLLVIPFASAYEIKSPLSSNSSCRVLPDVICPENIDTIEEQKSLFAMEPYQKYTPKPPLQTLDEYSTPQSLWSSRLNISK